MIDATREEQHEDVELLLPWYVNDTLSLSERQSVAGHVESCPECRTSLELLGVVSDTVQQAPAIPIVAEPKTDRLFDKIDQSKHPNRRKQILAITAIAASSAIVAVMLLLFINDTQAPAMFETATSTNVDTQTDYVLDIIFESGTADEDRDRVMRLIEATAVSREGDDDLYRVTVSLQASTLDELQRFTDDVESLPDVRSVEVIAVQLPMRRQ